MRTRWSRACWPDCTTGGFCQVVAAEVRLGVLSPAIGLSHSDRPECGGQLRYGAWTTQRLSRPSWLVTPPGSLRQQPQNNQSQQNQNQQSQPNPSQPQKSNRQQDQQQPPQNSQPQNQNEQNQSSQKNGEAANSTATAGVGRETRWGKAGESERTGPAIVGWTNDPGSGEAIVGRPERRRTVSPVETANPASPGSASDQRLVTGSSETLRPGLILICFQNATTFGLWLDAAFFDATCRVVPKRRHVCAVQIKPRFVLRICSILNAGWY